MEVSAGSGNWDSHKSWKKSKDLIGVTMNTGHAVDDQNEFSYYI